MIISLLLVAFGLALIMDGIFKGHFFVQNLGLNFIPQKNEQHILTIIGVILIAIGITFFVFNAKHL